MALINFDCPECGHNLEVDEGGAGFIVKCPECANPLQIPELPHSRRLFKLATAISLGVVVVALFAANAYFWQQVRHLRDERSSLQTSFEDFSRKAQLLAMQQEAEIERLRSAANAAAAPLSTDLEHAALDAIAEAESLSRQLEKTTRLFLDNNAGARAGLLREHMIKVVEASKNSLPAAPVVSDLGPGRGIQGRQIVFPILPGPDGQTLRENVEVTGVDEDKVSVRFAGGSATYSLSELHPGVAAFLPVDRLLVLPRRQWLGEVLRIHELQSVQRDERIAELRRAIEQHLSSQ